YIGPKVLSESTSSCSTTAKRPLKTLVGTSNEMDDLLTLTPEVENSKGDVVLLCEQEMLTNVVFSDRGPHKFHVPNDSIIFELIDFQSDHDNHFIYNILLESNSSSQNRWPICDLIFKIILKREAPPLVLSQKASSAGEMLPTKSMNPQEGKKQAYAHALQVNRLHKEYASTITLQSFQKVISSGEIAECEIHRALTFMRFFYQSYSRIGANSYKHKGDHPSSKEMLRTRYCQVSRVVSPIATHKSQTLELYEDEVSFDIILLAMIRVVMRCFAPEKFRRDFTNIQERKALFSTLPSGAMETGPREKELNSFSDERRRESVFRRHSEMALTDVTECEESKVGGVMGCNLKNLRSLRRLRSLRQKQVLSLQSNHSTCPYCRKMGYTKTSFQEHGTSEHAETSTEVICSICAALPEAILIMSKNSQFLLTRSNDPKRSEAEHQPMDSQNAEHSLFIQELLRFIYSALKVIQIDSAAPLLIELEAASDHLLSFGEARSPRHSGKVSLVALHITPQLPEWLVLELELTYWGLVLNNLHRLHKCFLIRILRHKQKIPGISVH
ncbi:hypothetical protein U0070_010860, partial [Myodes glareolus]